MKRGLVPKVLITLLSVAVILTTLINCNRADSGKSTGDKSSTSLSEPRYVGRDKCKECHEKEFNLYQGSDHDMAMDTAIAETVLGDFSDVTLTHFGVTSRFFMKDGKYIVNTPFPTYLRSGPCNSTW